MVTLLELIVVIGIISFLSNVVIRQISSGLEQKNLEGAADNLAVYFSNASIVTLGILENGYTW